MRGSIHLMATVLMLGCGVFVSTPLRAEPGDLPYLYERLNKNPVYAVTLRNLLSANRILPWLREYFVNRNGVDMPGKLIFVGGKPYEFYSVCEPHNCGGSEVHVLYEVGGERAVALLTANGKVFSIFGNPTSREKAALVEGESK